VAALRRHGLALLLALAQLLLIVPSAGAQASRLEVTFNPNRITSQTVGGCQPNTLCPLQRGVTYTVNVAFTVNAPASPMAIRVEGGGLEIEATGTDVDTTRQLPAGGSDRIALDITIPEANGRRDRTFYYGGLKLTGEQGSYTLPIAVSVPPPRIAWGPLTEPGSDERAPVVTEVGSGQTVTRRVTISSNTDAEDFAVRARSDRVTITGAPTTLPGGQSQEITIEYQAPIVNRKTHTELVLSPTSGLQALQSTLRMRLVILPVQITWSPPFVRKTLNIQDRRAVPITVTATSNYDVTDVRFKTADIGLMPITSPLSPATMRAGQPQPVSFLICPGYAPTQYFLGITAYQGEKPLNKRLGVRSSVIDPDDRGLNPNMPECVA
jgi:hypothetical protein